jgi:hypothetical protein
MQHNLIFFDDNNKPRVFSLEKSDHFAAYAHYPLFVDKDKKEVRIALKYELQIPKIRVFESIPYSNYPLSKIYLQ